jgi:hypothetical protein
VDAATPATAAIGAKIATDSTPATALSKPNLNMLVSAD